MHGDEEFFSKGVGGGLVSNLMLLQYPAAVSPNTWRRVEEEKKKSGCVHGRGCGCVCVGKQKKKKMTM